ncbi:MAG: TetR/AcrR family transcriptional regulator [Flavobacteriaceae bacterium]|nr:TetR/AcrR family transcriptional regulator [Flavobacteriaceae bacterium]
MGKKFTEKQIHILEIAEKLIVKKGFEAVSVREISSEANINVAMISYYFGSKEKMISCLYEYRAQKTRENFLEFAETIREGLPEMQMKELIKFVISQFFRYRYFHNFETREFPQSEKLKKELTDFYNSFTEKMSEVIKTGIASGVFINILKPEDLLTIIVGSTEFAIRNIDFYKNYIPEKDWSELEKKVKTNVLIAVFLLLSYE